jgi:hypothetical protein
MDGPAPIPPRPRSSPWLWAGLVFAFLACGCPSAIGVLLLINTPGGVTKPGASPPPRVTVEQFRQTLGRVRAGVLAAPAPSDLPCPDPLIFREAKSSVTTGIHGEARLRVTQVSYEALGDFVDKGPTALPRPRPGFHFTGEDFGLAPVPDRGPEDWQWLDNGALAVVFHPDLFEGRDREGSLQSTMREILDARYLVVLHASQRSMPRIIDAGTKIGLSRRSELRTGESFTPGGFQGALLVMDIDAASIVCQAKIDARSSASIEYRSRTGLLPSEKPSEALLGDFKDHLREAVHASLERISTLLQTSW